MKGGLSGSSFSTQESYSIFVDDLLGLADKEWFLNLFVQFSVVTDIYF